MEDLYTIFSNNLSELRKDSKMTQTELGEKVGYTYKAVSKWERGESLPDVETLKTIADLFGVSCDYLLEKEHAMKKIYKRKILDIYENNKIIITLLAVTTVWILATLIYVYCGLNLSYYPWTVFVWAVPLSCIVVHILLKAWIKNKLIQCIVSSIFIWSFLASFYLQLLQYNLWLIFILGIPFEIAVILWSKIK